MAARPAKPELVQFGDLTVEHFRRHAVWVGVHTMDYDEPWYDDTDEETFRPWLGERPIEPDTAMFLVRAKLRLTDGTEADGFVTAASALTPDGDADLGLMQPQMFLPDGALAAFWMGMLTEQSDAHARLYRALGREANRVFPITFSMDEGLARGVAEGEIKGFYYTAKLGLQPVVRV